MVDSLATFHLVNSKITPEMAILLAVKRKGLHSNLKSSDKVSWKDERNLESYCSKIASQVQDLEEAAHIIEQKLEKKDEILSQMLTCDFNHDTFKKKLEEIQSITDDFIFNDYSNIGKWVSKLNSDIESIFIKRTEQIINEWIFEFENFGEAPKKLITQTIYHEIKIRDQQLIMDPSVQELRVFWYKQLNSLISVICSQKRIESMKYDNKNKKGLGEAEAGEIPTFKSVLKTLSKDVMLKANSTIENTIKDASSYVSISGCQALWNVDFNKLYEKLEGNIPKWNVILNGLQQLIKRNFDSSETIKHFGAIVIDYQKAQDQVNTKFNGLKEFVLTKLQTDFSVNMAEFHQTIIRAKNQLELVSLDNPNIDVTVFITEIQEKNRMSSKWEKELEEIYEAGVSILKK